MLINQLRAILIERGLSFAQGRRKLELAIDGLLEDDNPALSGRMGQLIVDMREQWRDLDRRIAVLDREFLEITRSDETGTKPGQDQLGAGSGRRRYRCADRCVCLAGTVSRNGESTGGIQSRCAPAFESVACYCL